MLSIIPNLGHRLIEYFRRIPIGENPCARHRLWEEFLQPESAILVCPCLPSTAIESMNGDNIDLVIIVGSAVRYYIHEWKQSILFFMRLLFRRFPENLAKFFHVVRCLNLWTKDSVKQYDPK